MCLIVGRTYNIPTVAMRFFNVYGTRQALSNPYTGVLAIFASRLLNNHPPMIFEDGNQRRDFVSVYDVAQACRLALELPDANGRVFNVGSGHNFTVREVAERMSRVMNKTFIEPQITWQVPRRRYPALFCRHLLGAACSRLRTAGELRRRPE